MCAKSLQLFPILCDPMDGSSPGSSVHGISQARILEWFAISLSRGSSNPGTEHRSPALQADSLPAKLQGKPKHFTVYVNQVITSYALNLYSDICQLFLNKTGKKAHRLE